MLKWLRSIDWTPILASALILLICLWVIAPLSGHQFQHQPHSSAPNAEPQDDNPWWLSAGFWESAATAAIALFAVLQYRASDQTAERQLRAYVFPRGGQITNFGADKKFEVAVMLKNSGQTPAYQFVSGGAVSVVDYPLKDPLITEYDNTGHTVLGPGTEFAVRWVATEPLPKSLADAVAAGTAAIYADGVFSYIDAFDEPRTGKFRLFYGGKTRAPPSGEMSFYHEGNE